tara:strand:+ start:161 stop:319 length:159 start_codon:yes stop_codon:yes gene_type:complete
MKKILVTIFVLSTANTQKLYEIDVLKQNLEMVLELASRSEQKVFVDDFTGLL